MYGATDWVQFGDEVSQSAEHEPLVSAWPEVPIVACLREQVYNHLIKDTRYLSLPHSKGMCELLQ